LVIVRPIRDLQAQVFQVHGNVGSSGGADQFVTVVAG
jgi:hypothetical protein